jgi:hypothetical protein
MGRAIGSFDRFAGGLRRLPNHHLVKPVGHEVLTKLIADIKVSDS